MIFLLLGYKAIIIKPKVRIIESVKIYKIGKIIYNQ
jgi:hypothetical protein